MRSMRQLLRQPMKTLSGIVLITLAVAILCVCVGQLLIADQFLAALSGQYTSIAVPGFAYHTSDSYEARTSFPETVAEVIQQLIQEHPDLIIGPAGTGLATAYIPGLEMEYNHEFYSGFQDNLYFTPLCGYLWFPKCVMLEVLVTDVQEYSLKYPSGEERVSVHVVAIAVSAPGLAEGYRDLLGTELSIFWSDNVETYGLADAHEIQMEVGQRYLVYSMDFNPQGIANPYYFSDEPNENIVNLSQFPFYKYENLPDNQSVENIRDYAVPLYAKLEGTVEEFLASDEGAPWREALERLEVNNHAFTVLGVENLDLIPDFNYHYASIIDGREFTVEEIASGARVCVISRQVAEKNGLSVGDTLPLQFYEHDDNSVYRDTLAEGMGVVYPLPEFYTTMTPFAGDTEQYTIVGLYSQKDTWSNVGDNLYAFTPNTVFVPKAAVPVEMQYSNQGMFGVLELHDGTIEEFYEILDRTGYQYLFECYDQGYTVIKKNIEVFQILSQQVAMIGLAVYGMILLLYLVIFPAQQGNSLRLMNVMGTTPQEKMTHILATGVGILLPGTALGLLAATWLWDDTIQTLTEAVAVELKLQLDMHVLLGISVVQLLLALTLTALVSIPLLMRNPMKRK